VLADPLEDEPGAAATLEYVLAGAVTGAELDFEVVDERVVAVLAVRTPVPLVALAELVVVGASFVEAAAIKGHRDGI
jgi:hypothetical protein